MLNFAKLTGSGSTATPAQHSFRAGEGLLGALVWRLEALSRTDGPLWVGVRDMERRFGAPTTPTPPARPFDATAVLQGGRPERPGPFCFLPR